MQTSNYWKQFEKTGKIEDYLTYVQRQEEQAKSSYEGQATGSYREQTGEHPYAGIRDGNRNHTEADAYR